MSVALLLAAAVLVVPPPAAAVEGEPEIVFMRENFTSRLFVSNGRGTWTKPITGSRSEFALPRWGPRGRRIFYTRTSLNGWADSDLMVMRPRGGDKTVLLPGERRNWIDDMAWAPDGRRVVLVMRRDEVHDLWMYTLATGELEPLGVNRHPDRYIETVDWSPDGTIAFSALDFSAGAEEESDLYLVQPDGTGLEQLTGHAPPAGVAAPLRPGRFQARVHHLHRRLCTSRRG